MIFHLFLLNKCSHDLYADDTTIHTHNNNIDIIEYDLQTEFDNALKWSKQGKMNIHMKKLLACSLGQKKERKNLVHFTKKQVLKT